MADRIILAKRPLPSSPAAPAPATGGSLILAKRPLPTSAPPSASPAGMMPSDAPAGSNPADTPGRALPAPGVAPTPLDGKITGLERGDPERTTMRQLIEAPGRVVRSLAAGFEDFEGGMWSFIGGIAENLGIQSVADYYKHYAGEAERLGKKAEPSPRGLGFTEAAAYGGVRSIGASAPSLAAGAIAGPGTSLALMGASTAGRSYEEARKQGLDPQRAAAFGAIDGVIEAATERIPATKLFDDVLKGTGVMKVVLNQLKEEIPNEQIATLTQDLNAWAMLPENAEKPFSAFVAERPSAAAQTFISTLVATVGQSGGAVAAERLLRPRTSGDVVREGVGGAAAKEVVAEQVAKATQPDADATPRAADATPPPPPAEPVAEPAPTMRDLVSAEAPSPEAQAPPQTVADRVAAAVDAQPDITAEQLQAALGLRTFGAARSLLMADQARRAETAPADVAAPVDVRPAAVDAPSTMRDLVAPADPGAGITPEQAAKLTALGYDPAGMTVVDAQEALRSGETPAPPPTALPGPDVMAPESLAATQRLVESDPDLRRRRAEMVSQAAKAKGEKLARPRGGETVEPASETVDAPPVVANPVHDRYLLKWMADELRELPAEQGGIAPGLARDRAAEKFSTDDTGAYRAGVTAHVAGTPLQQMFAATGTSGSRAAIAYDLERYLDGRMKTPTKAVQTALRLAPIMDAAWDGQRFDWTRVTDEQLAAAGVRRADLRAPVTLPPDTTDEVARRRFVPALAADRIAANDAAAPRDASVAEQEKAPAPADADVSFDTEEFDAEEPDEAIQARTLARVEADLDGFVDRYLKDYGTKLNADDASELFPEYAASPEARASRVRAVRPAASKIMEAAFDRLLRRPVPPNRRKIVVFTSGGNGSGKSSTTDPDGPQAFIWDTTASQEGPTAEKIDRALAAGFKVSIQHVSVDPVQALTRAIVRASGDSQGRTVTLAGLASTHAGARRVLLALADRYRDTKGVSIDVFDNNGPELIGRDLDWLRQQEYPTGDDLRAALQDVLDSAYADGAISEAIYRGFLGRRRSDAPSGPGLRRGEGARPEDAPRADGRADEEAPVAAPAAPRPFTTDNLAEVFDLPAEQATAVMALAEAMGLPMEQIELVQGPPADAAPTSLEQNNAQTLTERFRRWFGASKVVDADGKPLVVYHGTRRLDRVGTRFLKGRATSGPMPFFTDFRELASKYAESKADTSLNAPEDYAGWFQVKIPGQRRPVDVSRAWYFLTGEQRAAIAKALPHVSHLDAEGNEIDGYRLDPDDYGLAGKDHWDWTIREKRGNVLAAAVDIWLNSAGLFGSERDFLKILELGGLTNDVTFDEPNADHAGVLPVYLSIQNPLDTSAISPEVVQALERRAARQRAPRRDQSSGDMWDKRSQHPRDWIERLKADVASGTNSHAWTSIPDWVTDTLTTLGYDGIRDRSGKNGGDEHDVWIPFEPTQIKSAIGNRGTFDPDNPNILMQGRGLFDDDDADILDTGEAQPRLPGDVGAVRNEERPTPKLSDIEDEFRLTPQYDKRRAKQNVLFQSGDAQAVLPPGFWYFDNILSALPQWQAKGTPEQLLAHLKKIKGAMDEAADIGLADWLTGKRSVTRDEVRAFVEAHKIEIKEVELSERGQDDIDEGRDRVREILRTREYIGFDNFGQATRYLREDPGQLERFIADEKLDADDEAAARAYITKTATYGGAPKYSNYVLGGPHQGYREILLTLPPRGASDELAAARAALKAATGEQKRLIDEEWDQRDTMTPEALRASAQRVSRQNRIVDDASRRVRELESSGTYNSSHFDQPNVLVHLRVNTRTLADGRRVLFAEEMQSDWHQAGRRKGYRPEKEKQLAALVAKRDAVPAITELPKGYESIIDRSDDDRPWGIIPPGQQHARPFAGRHRTEAQARAAAIERLNDENPAVRVIQDEIDALGRSDVGVPDAPFKGDGWKKLALKRLLAMAAEEGVDGLAWTTGEQQAERYDLSKQIGSIWASRDTSAVGEARYDLTVDDKNGDGIYDTARTGPVSVDELVDIVGKEMAEKIHAQPDGPQEYKGLQLKVGGEGMKGFYDREIVNLANDLAKKHGQRVEKGDLDTGIQRWVLNGPGDDGRYEVIDAHDVHESRILPNEDAARLYAKERNAQDMPERKVHVLPTPPTMRETLRRWGQALFQSAWHGSPHVFEKFSLHAIGTGEGQQAYGWGLYFSSSKKIADWYRNGMSQMGFSFGTQKPEGPATAYDVEQAIIDSYGDTELSEAEQAEMGGVERISQLIGDALSDNEQGDIDLAEARDYLARRGQQANERQRPHWKKAEQLLRRAIADGGSMKPLSGRTYKAEIPEDEDFLDNDRPITQQSAKVKDILKRSGVWKAYNDNLSDYSTPMLSRGSERRGENIYAFLVHREGSEEAASRYLAKIGVAGIRYRGAESGETNYVVFDDSAVQIMEFEQRPPRTRWQDAKASVEFTGLPWLADAKATIRALTKPDVSSPIHELAHVARRFLLNRDVPAEKRRGVSDEDIATVEAWAGAKDGQWDTPAEEKFARGFEHYVRAGGPTLPSSVREIFAKLAAWLADVYQSIAGSAIDVEITPEVRAVFDRLVTRKERLAAEEAKAAAPKPSGPPRIDKATGRKPGSWIIVEKATGNAVREVFTEKVAKAVNTEKYEAVPAGEYLGEFNRRVKDAGGVQPPPKPKSGPPKTKPATRTDAEIETLVREPGRVFAEAQRAYRAQEIGDTEFLATRKAFDSSNAALDADDSERQSDDPLSRVEQKARARMKDRGTTDVLFQDDAPLPLTRDDRDDLVVIGAAKLARGMDRKAWDAAMRREFGAKIDPFLTDLHTQASARANAAQEVDVEEYFNLRRLDVSDAEKQEISAAILETIYRTGRVPKERESWEAIRNEAREMAPEVVEQLKPFQEMQAPFRAVRLIARERIATLNQEIYEGRLALEGLPGDSPEALQRERVLAEKEHDLRGLLDVWMRQRSEDGRNLAMHRMMVNNLENWYDPTFWMSKARRELGLPVGTQLPVDVWRALQDILNRGRRAVENGQPVAPIQLELSRYLTRLQRSTWLEVISAVRKAGLLTGPKTHARNVLGNLAFASLEELSRVPAVVIDFAVSTVTGHRTVHGVSARAVALASREAATKGLHAAKEILRSGSTASSLMQVDARRELNSGIKWLDTYVNTVFRAMGATDRLFKSYAFRRSLEEQAALEAINQGVSPIELLAKPTAEMLARAVADAEFATFNNKNVMAEFVTQGKNALRRHPGQAGKVAAFAIDMAVPFVNTPSNILARMLDYTPGGATVALTRAAIQATVNRGLTTEQQRIFAQGIGRGATGSALIYLGYMLAAAGMASGMGGDDEGDRNVKEAAGVLPGAVKVGGRWHQIATFSPAGNLVSLGASIYRSATMPLKDELMRGTKIAAVAARLALDQPMLKGMSDLIASLQRPEARAEAFAAGMAGSFVPTFVNDVASAFDPYRRDTRPEGGFRHSLWTGVAARLPGARNLLPARLTVLGDQQVQDSRAIWDPTIATVARDLQDDVLRELIAHDVGITWPRQTKDETAEAYRQRIVATGAEIKTRVGRVIASPTYRQRNDEQQAEMIDKAIDDARRIVRERQKRSGPPMRPRFQ